jgi:hypothetical protein
MLWVDRISPVSSSVTVTVVLSAMARMRLRACDADAEVVHAVGAAEAHLPELVDDVVAQAVVLGYVAAWWDGFG